MFRGSRCCRVWGGFKCLGGEAVVVFGVEGQDVWGSRCCRVWDGGLKCLGG